MVSFNIAALVCLMVGISIATTTTSQITELTDINFGDFSKGKEFLLVDFYAPWCSDSKALAPELDKAALILGKRSNDVAKVDCFGKGKKLCTQLEIKHWPTLKTFRHGTLTSEYQGAHHAEAVANYVNGAEDIIQDNTYFTGENNVAASKSKAPATASTGTAAAAAAPVAAAIPPAIASTPAAAAVPAAAPAAVPASESEEEEEEGEGVETPDTAVQLPGTNEAGRMVSTPEEVLPIASAPTDVTTEIQKPENAAAVSQTITPSAETINQLECAKCRILTPSQRKQNPNCKSYKRECIPNFNTHYETQFNVNMVPGGVGRKRGKRYERYFGLRK